MSTVTTTTFVITFMIMLPCYKAIDSSALDDMFEEYARNSLPTRPITGLLYNATLPSNFTGVHVSIVRLRWDSFWRKGANYSEFNMPPRIFSYPYFPRLDIVYSSLGSQSSYYNNYNVPNYTLVAPVVGFNAYGPAGQKLNLTLLGGPILVQFPQNENAKCVTFYSNGTLEMSDVTQEDMCVVRDQGHFSIAVQVPPSNTPEEKDRGRKLWKWWVFGFGVGVVGLLSVGCVAFMIIRMRKIGKMEKEAENNEGLETANVGQSKMPLATVVRTQPVLETDYVP
ncbi:hypothetical protein QVD17_27796 [Tagetes erecta]|uniref:Uncharacterized protein n=1 Tax=Tagetes erecta TaxID=13708 RepID=A0AAD8NS35_TARER|nr:hypothetical protein QVD17_27796 [Tagetes erecta]